MDKQSGEITDAEALTKILGGDWNGRSGMACCPAHDDDTPSLSIDDGDFQPVLFCHAGCEFSAIRAALREKHGINWQPPEMTLALYAHAKRLPEASLKAWGLRDGKWVGKPAVEISYRDGGGREIACRYRVGMHGKDKFRWKKGATVCLYGLDRIPKGTECDFVFLVEGESDTQTLWHRGYPAIGVPGAANWREDRDAGHLERFKTIYAIIEPDGGGQALCKALAASRLRDRVRLVSLTPHKDVSALHISNPSKATFDSLLHAAMDKAETIANWEARQPHVQTVDELMREFNERYAVVNDGGNVVVLEKRKNRENNRLEYVRLKFHDFRNLHLNRDVMVKDKIVKAADVWLAHRDRAQYPGGIVFDPTNNTAPGTLNLWQGFGVAERPGGSWVKLRDHIEQVICNGDPALADWLLNWCARMLQFPAERGEVAVVLRGKQGVGKGVFADALMTLFGQHTMHISNTKHLTGHFNAHLRDCVFLFADEAFFAGDKQHVGVLKAIITERHLAIEGKFQNVVQAPNYLHLLMASNEDWVVPAAVDERRFLVLEVSDTHREDHPYFAAIAEELKHGGYEAMLHDLRHRDISGFNFRKAPETAGLQRQKQLSLSADLRWWQDVLARGYVYVSRLGLQERFQEWEETVSTELLFASYQDYAKQVNNRHPLSLVSFGVFMTAMGGRKCRPARVTLGERLKDGEAEVINGYNKNAYQLGSLNDCRDHFAAHTGLKLDWDESGTVEAEVVPLLRRGRRDWREWQRRTDGKV